jgi:hypothetical protein
MSIFNDKALKGVAEAAAKIMGEQLKGNQHKIDANKNGKVDAHDFKLLRAKKGMKEDVEQLDEVGDTPAGRKTLSSYVNKALGDKNREKGLRKATSRLYKDNYYGKKTNEEVELDEAAKKKAPYDKEKVGKAIGAAMDKAHDAIQKGRAEREAARTIANAKYGKMKKEEVEQVDEAFPTVADAKKRMAAGKTATGTVTKTATGLVHKRDYEDEKDDDDTPKKKSGYGARQNYKRSTRVNEELSFTEMLELYNEHGLKVLAPIETEEMDIDGTTIEVIDGDKVNGYVETTVEEEVTNDEFTKEFKDQQASFEGKKKQPKVAAGKTMGVKAMPEEVELDEEQLDERAKWRTSSIAHDTGYRKDGPHGGIENTADTGKEDLLRSRQMLSRYGTPKKSEVKSLKKSITKNIAQMKKEEVELDERTLTKGEAEKKEDYVKGMKKKLSGFKERYGERAKEVMYATATKMAKKD